MTERDDATGLDHTWWRKYESFSGRMTTPDPYGGSMSIANPQSFNRYNYTQNDPVNFIDSSGLDGDDEIWDWLTWSWIIGEYEANYSPREYGYANSFKGDFGSEMGLLQGKFTPQKPDGINQRPKKDPAFVTAVPKTYDRLCCSRAGNLQP